MLAMGQLTSERSFRLLERRGTRAHDFPEALHTTIQIGPYGEAIARVLPFFAVEGLDAFRQMIKMTERLAIWTSVHLYLISARFEETAKAATEHLPTTNLLPCSCIAEF